MLLLIILFCIFCAATNPALGLTGTQGFISIDCGYAGADYTDPNTKIPYTTDSHYISTGTNHNIAKNYISNSVSSQYQTVRSFPDAKRNCYMFPNLIIGSKYLLRASFMYGNYDGLQSVQTDKSLLFDLYLGVDLWRTVTISDAAKEYQFETITVARNFTWFCLIDIGHGTPFISTLELRPVNSSLYIGYLTQDRSISLQLRLNYGPKESQVIRYPADPFDRIWGSYAYDTSLWTNISTSATNFTFYDPDYYAPDAVIQTATTPLNSNNMTIIQWDQEKPGQEYVCYRYFCELQILPGNATREFSIYLNGKETAALIKPTYHEVIAYRPEEAINFYEHYVYTLNATSNSTLPPIINALELFSYIHHTNAMTHIHDVNAIMAIKTQYKVNKSWTGDPCSPSGYVWEDLACSSDNPMRIISLNLSLSGLTGPISQNFSNLEKIEHLDLSCNDLNGEIPPSLEDLSSLKTLNLSGNKLNGAVPDKLLKREISGLLTITLNSPCNSPPPNHRPKSKTIIVVLSIIISGSILIIAAIITCLVIRRRKQEGLSGNVQLGIVFDVSGTQKLDNEPPLGTDFRQFTYEQLENITTGFTRVIGKGGFGVVYHGFLEDGTEVAVKLASQAASRDFIRQFLSEAKNLMQVHHNNLVSLVGYCREGQHLALIYEYMPQGSLHDHLRGNVEGVRPMSWGQRLCILLEAAQGIDYLHVGRSMVHRDVKSSNILLGPNFEAKISDFGFSKILGKSTLTSFLTVCGTPGYIDPQATRTMILNEKSDVYSFGVVLLEIITGKPPIMQGQRNTHIIDYIKEKLIKGNIDEITDPRLQGEYEARTVWKVLDLAIRCTAEDPSQRPTMAEVAAQLKESLQLENNSKNKNIPSDGFEISHIPTYGFVDQTALGPSAR